MKSLTKQVLAMMDQEANFVVWTELNKKFKWLESESQTHPRFHGWTLHHDGLGIATMRSSETQAKHDPVTTKVYDEAMTARDPADRSRLEWRTIFNTELQLRDKPQHPTYHILVCIFMPVEMERNEILKSPWRRNVESRSTRCFVVSRTTLASSQGSERASACRCTWEIGICGKPTWRNCATRYRRTFMSRMDQAVGLELL